MKPALLLDVMGTLVRDPFYSEMAPFFGLSFEELLAQKHPTRWIEYECGQITEQQLLDDFFLDRRKVDREGLQRVMTAGYAWLPGVESLLAELSRAEAEMHLLSNYPEWYRWIEEKLTLSRYADWSFVSWHTGLHKPDPEAYLHAARSLGRAPESCLFVDDREVNCEAARGVGMPAILFRDAQSLRTELIELGGFELDRE